MILFVSDVDDIRRKDQFYEVALRGLDGVSLHTIYTYARNDTPFYVVYKGATRVIDYDNMFQCLRVLDKP